MASKRVDRIRQLAALVVLGVIPLGLFARSQRAGADPTTVSGFLATYTGDTLWPILFFFIGRFVFPRANRWRIVACTLVLTLTIEVGQLWQPAILQSLREQPVIGFLLGNSFLISDIVCLLVGSFISVRIDTILSTLLGDRRG